MSVTAPAIQKAPYMYAEEASPNKEGYPNKAGGKPLRVHERVQIQQALPGTIPRPNGEATRELAMQERNAKARAGASKPFPFGLGVGDET